MIRNSKALRNFQPVNFYKKAMRPNMLYLIFSSVESDNDDKEKFVGNPGSFKKRDLSSHRI